MSELRAQMLFLLLIIPLLFTNYIGTLLFFVYLHYEHKRITNLLMNKQYNKILEFIGYSIIILVASTYQH